MKFNLENRLIEYLALIVEIAYSMPKDYFSTYLSNQLVRSGLSSALYSAEAQRAKSRIGLVHKITIALKELQEAHMNQRVIERTRLVSDREKRGSIFVKSIETTKRNMSNV